MNQALSPELCSPHCTQLPAAKEYKMESNLFALRSDT